MTEKFDKSPADSSPPGATVTGATAAGPAPEAIKAIPVRHYGRWVSGVIVLALLVALAYAFSQGNIQWHTVGDELFVSSVVQGAGRTLLISVLAMVVGVVLGVVLAVMRLSKNPVTSTVAWLYIWFFRGTPVYVQLLLWFNLALIFPVLNLGPIYKNEMTDVMTPFMCALLGLGLNEAAYMAEICRAGLLAVDEGQTEAAHALGMSHTKTLARIVIPQAMRVIVPPTGNEFINMLKTSSLVYAVTYNELLRSTSAIGSTSYAVMEMLFVASIWYLAMTSVFSVFQYYLERYYARGSSRSLPPTVFQKIRANMLGLGRERGTA
ncbi:MULTISPECIES: amino acid ABC transporter permease [unclassified Streptomyces]|uniref:amino acid ABC transporter permease n=1 Tax=unclassified Streptomyces TaxID=2593676 RepID=UPI0011CE9B57|nr:MULTISPECIES: amino acid ABC transporter permease [unclassified Streptomyces]TXS73163.1 amino acid ABC transporter permease [Streptomyces sp. me109]